jgi:hypothetical protein
MKYLLDSSLKDSDYLASYAKITKATLLRLLYAIDD